MIKINSYRQSLLGHFRLNPTIIKAKNNEFETEEHGVVKDYLSQYGALPFGHNPDFAQQAIVRHIESASPVFVQPTISSLSLDFANQLNQAMGGHYAYCQFANSGAETVEAAIKLARLKTDRRPVLAAKDGFHGKTYSALSATGSDRYKSEHIVDSDGFDFVPFNDIEALRATFQSGQYAAFIVEPVQGEGGMNVATRAFLQAAAELCREVGTLFILDEIQTGIGRTGYMTAAQYFDVQPDVLLLAKALGAGIVASGAMLYRRSAYSQEFERKHSSTFAGNGLAMAAGLAVLERLRKSDESALKHVRNASQYVDRRCEKLLSRYPSVFSYRGMGLMRSLQIVDVNARNNVIINYAQNSGALAYIICSYLLERHKVYTMPLLSSPCSIRFEPPLDVAESDVDVFFDAMEKICELIAKGRYDILMAHLVNKPVSTLSDGRVSHPVSGSEPIAPWLGEQAHAARGKKFAFLMHTTSVQDVARALPKAIQLEYDRGEIQTLAQWMIAVGGIEYSPEVAVQFSVKGKQVISDGMLVFSPISAEKMLKLSPREKRNLMQGYLAVAEREGAQVIGLGAYTSVITRGGTGLSVETPLCLTTGNSLTAMSTLASIRSIFQSSVTRTLATVIGARGSVGKLIVLGLAHDFPQLILVGRPGSEAAIRSEIMAELARLAIETKDKVEKGSVLDRISDWFKQNLLFPQAAEDTDATHRAIQALVELDNPDEVGVAISSDYQYALGQAQCVVSATSEGKPFLSAKHLRHNAVAFDTARPFDFVNDGSDGAYIVEGGLVHQPVNEYYSDCNMVEAPRGVNLACLSETIALAMEGAEGGYSLGKSLSYEKAREIENIAARHGFRAVQYRPLNSEKNEHDYQYPAA